MASYIYTGGCKVLVENAASTHILDICNCSAYFFVEGFGAKKERRICPQNQLWNYRLGGCEDEDKILSERLCNRRLPWERCSPDTLDYKKLRIKNKCIVERKYSEAEGAKFDDQLAFESARALSNDVVLGNFELAAAAFIAGCVITLILIAIVLTMCKVPWFSTSQNGAKNSVTQKKMKTVVTEGDHVSISYEDIDEGDTKKGYKPMFGGSHLQLQGDTHRDSDEYKHTSSTPVTVSMSSDSHRSHDPPSKPPPAPPRVNSTNTYWQTVLKKPLPSVANTGSNSRNEMKVSMGKGPMKVPQKPRF